MHCLTTFTTTKYAYSAASLLKYGSCVFMLVVISHVAIAQSGCEVKGVKGQTPASAFPICGGTLFVQDKVPECTNYPIPAPGCRLVGVGDYKDKNPFWYTFTCYSSGTLGFEIDPKNPADNYNWQFYDITGHGASEIYSDGALVRAANWSGSPGKTGATSSGINIRECASAPGDNVSTYSKTPDIIEGHTYLLMVSHFNDFTQSGFTLSFKGGSAGIENPVTPRLLLATVNCDGTQLSVKFSKKMMCTSIAANGSDFEIQSLTGLINAAVGVGCSGGFSSDSVLLNLSNSIAPGTYTLAIKKGNDNNTLLDNCLDSIERGNAIIFKVPERLPAIMDSIITPSCAPEKLVLVFKKNIRCSSIAADGSDFIVTGPYPVKIVKAIGTCVNGLTDRIELLLAAPVVNEGTYTVKLINGTDGNAIADQCNLETPVGATQNFTVKDTVSAAFTFRLSVGCRYDTIHYFNAVTNGKTNWNWQFDNGSSTQANPIVVYNSFGNKTTRLITGNGFCSDTSAINFFMDHDTLRAAFIMPSIYCPNDLAYFKDTSIGKITNWYWQFGNGLQSILQSPPPQQYTTAGFDRLYPVQLIVKSDKACFDTSTAFLKVANNCRIAVPSAFTPNNDGLNDYLYPLNAYKASNLTFTIFNRQGNQLFSTKDRTFKWDGTFKGEQQSIGVYMWRLQYTDADTGKQFFSKGTTVLLR